MMDFHGVKIALIYKEELIMHLRDDEPGLFNANMWDFPGGGREGEETAEECAIREIKEELEIEISNKDIIWKKFFPAQKDPNQKAVFMVAEIDKERYKNINLTEGQKWQTFSENEFLEKEDVIQALKERYRKYLETK